MVLVLVQMIVLKVPQLSTVFDRINTNNGDISLVVYSGNSQDHGNIQIESGATVQSDGTNDKQGTSMISGDVKVIGQVFANTGESVSIEGADSNIIIDASGVAGSGVLTLAKLNVGIYFRSWCKCFCFIWWRKCW